MTAISEAEARQRRVTGTADVVELVDMGGGVNVLLQIDVQHRRYSREEAEEFVGWVLKKSRARPSDVHPV